jgi:steroid 5-alpha reductase family enzyme
VNFQMLGLGAIVIVACMLSLWLISVNKRDASIIDAFWGPGFAILAWTYALSTETLSNRGLLLAILVTIWGLRLGVHIAARGIGESEDYRYARMRSAWGERFWWVSLLTVFGFQGLLLLTISLPLLVSASSPEPLGIIDFAGVLVFTLGFTFEAVSDFQLTQFKSKPDNRGTTLRTGLWRYTRHPNYFGDALLWWGLFVVGGMATDSLWTAISPALMTLFLIKVSGVPLTEDRLRSTRSDFAAYAAVTSTFLPWPPKVDVAKPKPTPLMGRRS